MYHQVDDFLTDWEAESGKTRRILEAVTDEALAVKVTPEGRTVRTLAWHLVTSLSEMMGRVGFRLEGPAEDAPEADSAAAILDGYAALSGSLDRQIREHWTNESLAVTNDMYGEHWPNAKTLQVLIRHEVHHRAQLTVLLRQAGVKVPGIYGPSREEWGAFGMEAQA